MQVEIIVIDKEEVVWSEDNEYTQTLTPEELTVILNKKLKVLFPDNWKRIIKFVTQSETTTSITYTVWYIAD